MLQEDSVAPCKITLIVFQLVALWFKVTALNKILQLGTTLITCISFSVAFHASCLRMFSALIFIYTVLLKNQCISLIGRGLHIKKAHLIYGGNALKILPLSLLYVCLGKLYRRCLENVSRFHKKGQSKQGHFWQFFL